MRKNLCLDRRRVGEGHSSLKQAERGKGCLADQTQGCRGSSVHVGGECPPYREALDCVHTVEIDARELTKKVVEIPHDEGLK